MGQIELFNLLQEIIIISYLKLLSCGLVVHIKLKYLINRIISIR